jgi:hypothetical protein
LGTFKKYRFGDIRIFIKEEDKDPIPTPRGLTISPSLWPQFKAGLVKMEEAMIAAGWLDAADLEIEE